jgi:hypothetical protein
MDNVEFWEEVELTAVHSFLAASNVNHQRLFIEM